MIQIGERFRLTSGAERSHYRVLTSCLPSTPDPHTLSELHAPLEAAASYWERSKTDPDGQAIAERARNFIASH